MSALFHIETTRKRIQFSTGSVDSSALEIPNHGENLDTVLGLIRGWTCLLADSPLNRTSKSEKPPSTFDSWWKYLTTNPIRDTIVRFSKLSHLLVSQPTNFGSGSSTGDWIPEFMELPIFREYHAWYRSGDANLLKYIYTFLNFGKKLKFVDDALEETAFRGWISVEQRLCDLELDDNHTDNIREIISRLVPRDFPNSSFSPKFGPGRVSEPGIFGVIQKSDRLLYDAKLDRSFFRSHYVSYGLLSERGFSPDKVIPDPIKWNAAGELSRRYSRLKFVPKDMTKSRSICAEPNTFMFFQQGFARFLVNGFSSTIASRFIRIDDQSRNRALALYGSYTGEIDTIDLSAASDSVSIDLVKRVFPRDILYFLLATRTPKVMVPDGRIVDVKKFAPMGSALCFPVQCLIFSSIVIYAAMLKSRGFDVGAVPGKVLFKGSDVDRFVETSFRHYPSYVRPGTKTYQPASVYGDDICVDQSLTPYVVHLLTSLGFEVNSSKSFTSSQCFRESCGGYYYCGEDVTPIYYRVQGAIRGRKGYESLTSSVSLANHAGDAGYLHLRRHLVQSVLYDRFDRVKRFGRKVNPIPFCRNTEWGLGIKSGRTLINNHLSERLNNAYQREEHLCVTVRTDRWVSASSVQLDGVERYLHLQWWTNRREAVTECSSHSASRRDPSGSRLGQRWILTEN